MSTGTDRIRGAAHLAQLTKQLDPANFGREPVASFIDALVQDLNQAADEIDGVDQSSEGA